MDLPGFDTMVALLSIAIPVLAFVWEFFVGGLKRLGYRIQMDTTATEAAQSADAGVLRDMQQNGAPLTDPSFVLLRIENTGWTPIVTDDYLTPNDDPVGIRVRFPHRRVAGTVVTELSQPALRDSFVGDSFGVEQGDGVIKLPKVKLNPRAHYKVLAVLEREPGYEAETFPDPEVVAGLVGGRGGGRIRLRKTEGHVFASKPAQAFMALVVLVSITQAFLTFTRDEPRPAPLDCAGGTLHLHGSTAFAPVVLEAAKQYQETCEAKGVKIVPTEAGDFEGSGDGLEALNAAGDKVKLPGSKGLGDRLTFSDGRAEGNRPRLLPRPVALSLFTFVVNKDTGVQNLTRQQLKDIYAGEITNWSKVGGNDVPIHLVSRRSGSGTRVTLVQRVLDGRQMPQTTVDDCTALDPDKYGRCEVGDTGTMLDKVATIPGALGHSEVGRADGREDLFPVRIDGQQATLEGVEQGTYPFWQTEYAYTFGEPPADSIAAAFLRYLANEVGKDVLRSHGNRPCSELEKPLLCEPT
ncbi:substrate-binding domain-containing protein [Streptomyces acidicola]|uniref:Phosphate-binding protein n=1 Tax=Streptomyces acidicola TaxID=2596892 RepID=A0A5N8WZN0_9ACTN|nr:substrate-binding domain-containing protein [Streptomyces acidicola]MPY52787.1 phosphate-binding protein [Streptomyces acidicola]